MDLVIIDLGMNTLQKKVGSIRFDLGTDCFYLWILSLDALYPLLYFPIAHQSFFSDLIIILVAVLTKEILKKGK